MPLRMDLSDLNWNLLRSFCVIAEEKGLTRAARRLKMSQPSVSLALQKLEEQLGCQLIFRDSRHFALTLQGEKIHQECGEMFRAAERIGVLAGERGEEQFGEVRLSIISQLRSPLIDEALRLYHQRYPSITWRIEVRNSAETVHRIGADKAGMGICLLVKPLPNLTCRHLFREEFGIFCGVEHSLFGCSEVSVHDLQQEPFIAFTCATEGMGLEPMIMLREGLNLGKWISGSSQDLEEVQRMIVSGLGIGILPIPVAENGCLSGKLWQLRLIDQPLGADVFLVHHAATKPTMPEQKFIDLIEELMSIGPDMS